MSVIPFVESTLFDARSARGTKCALAKRLFAHESARVKTSERQIEDNFREVLLRHRRPRGRRLRDDLYARIGQPFGAGGQLERARLFAGLHNDLRQAVEEAPLVGFVRLMTT